MTKPITKERVQELTERAQSATWGQTLTISQSEFLALLAAYGREQQLVTDIAANLRGLGVEPWRDGRSILDALGNKLHE